MDRYLASIASAAESGALVPPVHLVLSSGDVVEGAPVRELEFDVAMEAALAREYSTEPGRVRRGSSTVPADPQQLSEAALRVLDEAAEGGDLVLTLAPAVLIRSGRTDGIRLPAVRVSCRSVAAWWIAGAHELASGRGWSFGLGVLFPIDE
jgi:hypothetical protein